MQGRTGAVSVPPRSPSVVRLSPLANNNASPPPLARRHGDPAALHDRFCRGAGLLRPQRVDYSKGAANLRPYNMSPRLSRRSFLKKSAFGAAAAWTARSWSQVAGANSDVRLAI